MQRNYLSKRWSVQEYTGNFWKYQMVKKELLVEAISALYIILFVYAAVSKVIDYEKFTVQLAQSPMLTEISSWVAWIIPVVEIVISMMLMIPAFKLLALFACFSLMVMFTSYIIVITNFSNYVPCSCGGILQEMTWNQHLVFNIFFVALALAGIFFQSNRKLKR